MPNTPDNKLDWGSKPLIITNALKELEEREAEQAGYQELKGYIWEVMTLIEANAGNSKNTIECFVGKAHFLGFELTGIVPHEKTLLATVRLFRRVDVADLYKSETRAIVSLDLFPAGLLSTNEQLLEAVDYTLALDRLTKHDRLVKTSNTITPSDATFDTCLKEIRFTINTAREMLQVSPFVGGLQGQSLKC